MKVKELIEILQELPKEASINFRVGEGERTANDHAKAQLRTGEVLSLLRLQKVDYKQYIYSDNAEAGFINLVLYEMNYTPRDFLKYVNEFDELTDGIDIQEDL